MVRCNNERYRFHVSVYSEILLIFCDNTYIILSSAQNTNKPEKKKKEEKKLYKKYYLGKLKWIIITANRMYAVKIF